jgi:hypothetical protein
VPQPDFDDDEELDLDLPVIPARFVLVMTWEDEERGVLQEVALFEGEAEAEIVRSQFAASFAEGRPGERLIALSVKPAPPVMPILPDETAQR